MGICDIKNNTESMKPHIEIKPEEGKVFKNKKDDSVFPGSGKSIKKNKLKIISNQKESTICKIIKNDRGIGTGFLCYMDEFKTIKCLITAFHVLGEEDLKIGNEIKITFNDDNENIKILKIDGPRYIYASKKEDISIIEILDSDNLQNYNILEIDESIFNNYIDFYNEYKNKEIYILHFPEGKFSSFSDNYIIDIDKDNYIYHYCSTDHGSSGAPILNLDTFKVIGVHQGSVTVEKELFHDEAIIKLKEKNKINRENKILCNIGKIMKESLNNFNKKNKILLTLKITKNDINKQIYFLQNYYSMNYNKYYNHRGERGYIFNADNVKGKESHKLNIDNFVIFINDKLYESKEYFIPEKVGIYHIKIITKNNIQDCFGLFYDCLNIIDIDLSSFDTKNVSNMSYMFSYCENLENINLSFFSTKNVTDMKFMFSFCEKLENINLSFFNTKNVTDMEGMFNRCINMKNINLSSFDTKNVTNMRFMFYYCKKLKNINLSSFDTKNVTNMESMFSLCKNLENINLPSFDTKNVTNMEAMFWNCKNIENLDLSSFDTKNVTNMKIILWVVKI